MLTTTVDFFIYLYALLSGMWWEQYIHQVWM